MKLSAPVFSTESTGAAVVSEPAPAAAPITSTDGSDVFDIDANMAEFFGHSLSEPAPAPNPAPTAVVEPNPAPAPALNPAPAASPSPAQPTPNAEPAASAPDGGGDDEVDPNLLAAVLLGDNPPAPTAAPAAAAPAVSAAAPPAGESDDNKPYMPIQASEVKIPSAVLQTIFNSEDPVQQEQALVQLLAGWGNAIISMADARVRDHYGPRFAQQAVQQQQFAAEATRTNQDFFTAYPDLEAVPQIVSRVAAVVAKQNPGATYPQVKDKIGKAARALAKQMGVTLSGAPAAAGTPPAPFVAGGARPASHGSVPSFDPTDPAQMVDQLADAGFTF